ncbi:MAG: AbrB/MazE/SpoVT family DNA-binding domain-containing protein [Proteobacteria bacterium]|nr:AbrB/MazE/SpoVT family DNA-binding domain-containing protein [Pseudomonadota bacterium]NBP16125.1 AbrB/MazE/SpoVT family DNA-binding domain-containing protein [bacterium]
MDKLRWKLEVKEDLETGDAVLEFPPDFLELTGWSEGDKINWRDNGDGSWTLEKK